MKIQKFLLYDRNIRRSAIFWNAFSAALNSFQTMFLLLVITRTGNMNDASIFATAYAAGNLLVNIGKFGSRQVQVTDVQEKYSFCDYLAARRVSVVWMLLVMAGYLSAGVIKKGYSGKKVSAMLMVCLLKSIEAYEDVYHGRMQQKGRLDTAGKILGIRLLIYMVGFGCCYILTRNLVFTCAINVLVSFFVFLTWNHAVLDAFVTKGHQKKEAWKTVLSESFPVGISLCLYMYICNAPKLIVDTVLDDYAQACFNILFMAVFVMSLLGGFLTTPLIGKIGERWVSRNISGFFLLIRRSAVFIIFADACLAVLGYLVGCNALGWLYHVDLSGYRVLLPVLLVAGGIISLQNLFNIAVTAIGYQKYMLYGYGLAAGVMFFFGKEVVMNYGLYGLASFFLLVLALLAGYCAMLMITGVKNRCGKCGRG